MNGEFDWTGLPEISGFGGGYEAACRKMVRAGAEWLRAHPDAKIKADRIEGVYPDIWNPSPDLAAMQDAMAEAVGNDCTGAMVCAATHHAICIHKIGWEKYAEELKKARAERKEVQE